MLTRRPHRAYRQTPIWSLTSHCWQFSNAYLLTKTQYIALLTRYATQAILIKREQLLKLKPQKKEGHVPKSITIFTTNTCAYCVMVERFLDMKGLKYEIVNLDEQPELQQEVLEMSGALTVPITVVTKQDDSKEVVIGYNIPRLAPAVA
ncbi:MAG TPA: glutaredoxin [Candidatus Saccharimonadales bacterium]